MRFIISKAYAAPAGGRGTPNHASSPTSAGTSSAGGVASRGGKSVGQRPDGTPVYETELKARSGRGGASGNKGNTHKEAQKASGPPTTKRYVVQNNGRPAPRAEGKKKSGKKKEAPPPQDENAQEEFPAEHSENFHHTGVERGKHNYKKKVRDHNGVDHTIMNSQRGEDGNRYYIVHSSDSEGRLSKVSADHLHDYVDHMDSKKVEHHKKKDRVKEEKALHDEFLTRKSLFYITSKSMTPVDAKDKSTQPGEFVVGGMWSDGETKVPASRDKIPGGRAGEKKDEEFDLSSVTQGANVEREHTTDPEKAKEIAKDHLEEDPRYYVALEKMERDLKASKPVQKSFVIHTSGW